ncbi:MAG: hypothetical protein V4820_11750 [Pseudomonadota bacterium]
MDAPSAPITIDCPRAGKLFGCKFRGRYDVGPPHAPYKLSNMTEASILDALKLSRPTTYVCDVCEKCGKTVERVRA